jgi:hypothetical protein
MPRDGMHALELTLRDPTHSCQRRDDDSFWSNVFCWKFAEYVFTQRHLESRPVVGNLKVGIGGYRVIICGTL